MDHITTINGYVFGSKKNWGLFKTPRPGSFLFGPYENNWYVGAYLVPPIKVIQPNTELPGFFCFFSSSSTAAFGSLIAIFDPRSWYSFIHVIQQKIETTCLGYSYIGGSDFRFDGLLIHWLQVTISCCLLIAYNSHLPWWDWCFNIFESMNKSNFRTIIKLKDHSQT